MQARSHEDIRRPQLGWTMMETPRFLSEAAMLAMAWPMLLRAPAGDGHPVMVLPGFATNDAMTGLLRAYLAKLGYAVFPWDLGWNLDQHSAGENGEHLAERIEAIAQLTGRKVSLVGWSLGGVIAREAARRDHGALRQVVTLGSPFTGNPRATSLTTLYELLTGNKVSSDETAARYARGHDPLPVPSSAIFSRSDGITAWENCVSQIDPQTENIEVHCSHFGFVSNPGVFWAVADRLALPEGQWAPFVPKGPFAGFFP
ncbi:alpha/beta hydrolase [Novosphingobium sp. ERN07]|uniref:esterase/lipase family protein n=1 Tax=Novosphingobium sp. ERN07 TaxID=2726187 RepID=UPI001456B938|nr:alpha/beta hydrolase [Novosphingobium sp. ERN07]NLR71987.1 alpha/beta hydrolase [Novosphingobium sp. ERN07]